jgi:secondary thiamine-phosphate synthase enzyme
MCHLFLKHTSASLCLNENADPAVRRDFSSFFRKTVPDGASYFQHTLEGRDDMSAHLKSALLGVSLLVPVREGRLVLGTWQGVYLGEHREERLSRSIFVTIWGEPFSAADGA